MEETWIIEFYETSSGDIPVRAFIDGLELRAQSKIYNTLELLKQYGIRLGSPHTKKLIGTDLWELRILGGDSLRVFYIAVQNKTFLLLHGFKKKTQKTQKKEMKTAIERLREYKAR